MPWRPMPRIAFAVAIYPFQPSSPADLPLELGDELYIIEQGGADGEWYRGYLVAPPSLLAGLTSVKGQTLEARVFSGIFPRNCVEIREVLGDSDGSRAPSNLDRLSTLRVNGIEADQRSSSAFSEVGGDGSVKGEVSSVVIARKGKPAQILIQKPDEDDATSRKSSSIGKWGGIPLTPVTISPRDPDAPKPPAPVPMLKIGDETPTSLSEPLVDEIASCLREWHSSKLHELLLARQYRVLEEMSSIVVELDLARRQLLHDVLTAKEKETLRREVVWKLVKANKMLSNEVVVRDPDQRGRLLTGEDSAIQLTKLQSEMSTLDRPPTPSSDASVLHHLLLEVNAVSGNSPGPVSLAMYLGHKTENGTLAPLSETYILDIPSPEKFASMGQGAKLKTLFTELSAADIGDGSAGGPQLYLVVTVLAPELAPVSAPALSRSSTSRDGSSSSKPPVTANASVKGNLKTRRSMMWAPKSRGIQGADPVRDTATGTPQSPTSSNSSKDALSSQLAAKESKLIRAVGVGIIEVSHLLRQDKDTEQIVNVWSPAEEGEHGEARPDDFDELIRVLLPSHTGKYARSHRAARLHVHLSPFAASDAGSLVRSNPTVLHDVVQTRRIGFAEAPTKPRSDIYVTLSQAVFPVDALLSHPQAGQVAVPAAFDLRHIQLTLEVRDSSGRRIERCIFPSSHDVAHTAWRTTVAARGTPWNQTIRLKIPDDQIPGSHLIMSVADAPEFPFALAWMPLMEQQAFIRDGRHSLLLHFYDKQTSSIENGKGAYLSLPWSALGRNESAKDEAVTGPLATLRLETHLCSTQYSHDEVLLTLLSWKERPLTQVLETLKRLAFVPDIEIAKQLNNVFDALFGILVENAGNEDLEDLVFRDVVTVLGLVHDRRFNLGPLVDHYTDEEFYFPFATQCLIRSYVRLLQAPNDAQQSRYLRAAFKVGKHILRFIINAREQQKAKEEGIGITNVQSTFSRDLHTVFKSLEALMRNPSPSLVGSKTLAVQHFHTWLPQVSKAIGKDEMVMIALSFIDSCNDVQGMLILYKLVLIQNYTQLEIFAEGPERRTLLSSCVGWLAPHWGSIGTVTDQYRDQVRLCCAVVSQFIKHPDPQVYEFMPKIVASYCAIVMEGVEETSYLSLLFSKTFPFQVKAFQTSQRFDEALVELAAVIAGIAMIPEPKFLVLKELEVATFIAQALEAHNSILNCEAYPQSWLSLHIYNHRAAIKSLRHLSTVLIDRFLPAPDDAESFDTKLWEAFFMTLLKVVSSNTLALETFPEQKRRAVWKIAGDVRDQGAELLRTTWEAIGWDATEEERERYGLQKLGGYQVQYVPGLIAPIIELCLSVHEDLRHVAVDVLRMMILSEWDLNQDISIIEMEIISSLDGLFKAKHVNDSIVQKLFINELLELFEGYAAVDEDLTSAVKDLLATVDELLDLLVAAQSGSMTESLHTLKLMEYMKDMGREDIFIRYVHELAEAQAAAGNYTEAGLALQFHADLYEWDGTKAVPAIANPALPEQTSFERKESLYFSIIQHFEDGKAWAHALSCYKELVGQYESAVMDFVKLSRAQSSMARIYESIAKEDKQFPRYFRVVYKGLGFPTSLRDKEFIFEGLPSERMASFVDRMQRENPAAQILSTGEEQNLEGQFLQISAVTVHRDLNHPVYQRSKIPQSVRDHLLISTPSQFSVTTKRKTHGADVKDICVEKIIFTTAEQFPNILRRSEIVAAEEISLSPLQTAIERTWRRTQELWLLEKRAAAGDDPGLSGLTDALQQLLDMESASANCVALYRQFLTSEETKDEEDGIDELDGEGQVEASSKPIDPMENSLAVALIDHALAIKHALSLYSRPAHQATQGELLRRFEEAFAPEIESLALVAQDSSHPSSYQAPNSPEPRQTPSLSRPMSPEQELIRSSRNDVRGKHTHKQSVSQRISIINPFKRSNHGLSDSVATIQPSKAGHESPHINGSSADHFSSPSTAGDTHGRDDDAATVHSRTTSRSGGLKRDTQQKRRSIFGGDKTHQKLGSTVSITAGNGNGNGNSVTDDVYNGHKTRGSRSGSRDASATSRDGRSRSGSQRTGGLERDKPHQPKHGGWSTIPPPSDLQRPLTAQSSLHSLRDQADGSDVGSHRAAQDNPGSSSAKESVFRRFSLLKGVGRKNSRPDFKSGGNRIGVMTVQEE